MNRILLILAVLATLAVAEEPSVIPAETLAKKWKKTKSLAAPVESIRKTTVKGLSVETKVDADSQERFQNIQFTKDSAEIDGAVTARQLDEIAKAMNMAGTERFLIEGHTCDLGTQDHNKDLSQRRADRVIAELATRGVNPQRLRAQGFGEEEALVANTSEADRERNRRVEVYRILE
jgi:outer membrane protein OmpA-like peptidoglycan-associated protein